MNPNDEANDEATNDYSSYWQSIPDPPTPTSAALPEKISTGAVDTAVTRLRKRRYSCVPLKDVTNHALLRENDFDGAKPVLKARVAKSDDGAANRHFSELDERDTDGNNSAEFDGLTESFSSRGRTVSKNAAKVAAKSRSDKASSAAAYHIHHSDDFAYNNDELVRLVRKYCSLPLNQQVNSRESKEIEAITGYPMPGKILDIFDGDIETCKREFLSKAQPIVLAMEQQKQKDIDDTRSYTQCEVKRNPKEGGFQYVDVKSLKPVSSDEYKARYSAMIDERRTERRQAKMAASKWFNKLSPDEKASSFADDSNMEMDDSIMWVDNFAADADDVSSCTRAPRSSLTISTINNLSTQPLSNDSLAERKDPKPVDNNANTNDSPKTSTTVQAKSKAIEPQLLAGVMPPSDDPRIIEARRKLFLAIDRALANYSCEILALNEKE
ncbi:hypothetical protein ACHAW6_005305 [Cyclotella cf. meneghiniana]